MSIIYNFYSNEDYAKMHSLALSNLYAATYQPNKIYFEDRLKAYPCYETAKFLIDSMAYNIFKETFEKKTNFKILNLKSFFRKILSSELKIIFKYGTIPHRDSEEYDIAGVIYYNINSLYDGTAIYDNLYQREPSMIIGAKTNKCVFYDANQLHAPLQDKDTETRLIQPFFIKLQK